MAQHKFWPRAALNATAVPGYEEVFRDHNFDNHPYERLSSLGLPRNHESSLLTVAHIMPKKPNALKSPNELRN